MWVKFIGCLWWLIIVSRVYFIWSKVYRWLWQRKYRFVPLQQDLSVEAADKELRHLKWRADGWRELWDSTGSPHFVQHAINEVKEGREQPKRSLDCDDFSSWASHTIHKMYDPLLFSVGYAKNRKPKKWYNRFWHPFTRLKGHMMCLTYDASTGLYKHRS